MSRLRKGYKELRQGVREYLTFTESEIRGTLALIVVIVLLLAVRWSLPYFHYGKLNRLNGVEIHNPDSLIAVTNEKIRKHVDSLDRIGGNDVSADQGEIERTVFAFDPNTVSFPDLLRLGFGRKLANNIVRYRSKGGKFRSANDLYKMYGMDSALVDELKPFIVLPEAPRYEPKQTLASEAKPTYNSTQSYGTKEVVKTRVVELNTADSATLVEVRGIGPAFASRIIKFRNRLGGFVSKEQLKDVYGITPEHYDVIAPGVDVNADAVKKIKLNSVTFDELRQYVYVKYNVAKAIVAYRDQHGPFRSKEELKQVALVDDALYQKLEPYISLE